MNLEMIPRQALTHAGATLAGFMLAMWCMRTPESAHLATRERPGFVITLKSTNDSKPNVSDLGKKQPLLIHHRFNSFINGPCISKLENLQTRRGLKFIQILGEIGNLDQIVPFLRDLQSGQSWISEQSAHDHVPDCGDAPTVEYGSHP